jgi:GxxExxY protein
MNKLIHSDKTYRVIGLCMEVHRHLGPGLLEIVYKDALEYEFRQHQIPYDREKKFEVAYKDTVLPRYFYADFLVFDSIILEAKATKKHIAEEHIAWTLNYMKLSNSRVGLIVNFGGLKMEFKRLVK